MRAAAGPGPVPILSAPAAALPGLTRARSNAAAPADIRRPRPAAASRAGLFPWVPVCLSLGIALWFAWPALPGTGFWIIAGGLGLAGFVAARLSQPLAERGRIGWAFSDGLRIGGMAIVLVEQFFSFAYGLADRFYVLNQGRVTLSGAKSDVSEAALMEAVSV